MLIHLTTKNEMEKVNKVLIESIAQLLLRQHKLLATAESCTGGIIASSLVELAGASAWFDRGFVTYSNAAKVEQLMVRQDLLDTFGAVSKECVTAMLTGLLKNSNADYGLSVSGIAGPNGGSVDNPVGTVWLACGSANKQLVKKYHFLGDRTSICIKSANQVLENLVIIMQTENSY